VQLLPNKIVLGKLLLWQYGQDLADSELTNSYVSIHFLILLSKALDLVDSVPILAIKLEIAGANICLTLKHGSSSVEPTSYQGINFSS